METGWDSGSFGQKSEASNEQDKTIVSRFLLARDIAIRARTCRHVSEKEDPQ